MVVKAEAEDVCSKSAKASRDEEARKKHEQAMTYGEGIVGVSTAIPRDQRRVAAAILAPASGAGG